MDKLFLPSKTKGKQKALVCYLPESYTLPTDHPNFLGHSNFQECRTLLNCLVENGFSCDVLPWNADVRTLSGCDYDLFIGFPTQLEYGKSLVNKDGKVILYATSCHWPLRNLAEYERLNQLKARRGSVLLPRRQTPPVLFEEQIDEIWYFGNDFQKNTYDYLPIPKHRLNISTIPTQAIPKSAITDSHKKNFLWFGSAGAVHKGLDWVLEIFSKNTELHLHVCGLVELEKDFVSAYNKELFHLPNIHFHGWVLPNSPKYHEITSQCGFIISPSCSEGGGGAVLQCMSAGLIPILTKANALDTEHFGFTLDEDTIENTENMILYAAQLQNKELLDRSILAYQFIQKNHTLEHYKKSILKRISTLKTKKWKIFSY